MASVLPVGIKSSTLVELPPEIRGQISQEVDRGSMVIIEEVFESLVMQRGRMKKNIVDLVESTAAMMKTVPFAGFQESVSEYEEVEPISLLSADAKERIINDVLARIRRGAEECELD